MDTNGDMHPRFRGSAPDDGYGYAPNFSPGAIHQEDFPAHRRQGPQPRQRQGQQAPKKEHTTWVPPGGAYEAPFAQRDPGEPFASGGACAGRDGRMVLLGQTLVAGSRDRARTLAATAERADERGVEAYEDEARRELAG